MHHSMVMRTQSTKFGLFLYNYFEFIEWRNGDASSLVITTSVPSWILFVFKFRIFLALYRVNIWRFPILTIKDYLGNALDRNFIILNFIILLLWIPAFGGFSLRSNITISLINMTLLLSLWLFFWTNGMTCSCEIPFFWDRCSIMWVKFLLFVRRIPRKLTLWYHIILLNCHLRGLPWSTLAIYFFVNILNLLHPLFLTISLC